MKTEIRRSLDDLASMWSKLDDSRKNLVKVTEIPEKYFTTREYYTRYNLPYQTAACQLAKLVREKALEFGFTYLPTPDGRLVRTKVFWPMGGICKTKGCGGTTDRIRGKKL